MGGKVHKDILFCVKISSQINMRMRAGKLALNVFHNVIFKSVNFYCTCINTCTCTSTCTDMSLLAQLLHNIAKLSVDITTNTVVLQFYITYRSLYMYTRKALLISVMMISELNFEVHVCSM